MDQKLLFTTIATILLAILGYLATYLNNLRLSQRQDKLARVNKQLSELYGPMFALSHASSIAWKGFRTLHRPNKQYFFDGDKISEEDLKAWRLWMTTVFMPMNQKMYDLILTKSDLLIETEMPECLLLFCAHVAAYQAVLEKWRNNDFSEQVSVINYPNEIESYAQATYAKLKAEQAALLGR